MTKFVTATKSLVLSPVTWPSTSAGLADVYDAFGRAVVGLVNDEIGLGVAGDRRILAHKASTQAPFYFVPLLRDGSTMPNLVPPVWAGKITRAIVAAYLRAEWLLVRREPSWGAHLLFGETTSVDDELHVRAQVGASLPLIDPIRDIAGEDDPSLIAVRPELAGDFAGLLTDWEAIDGCLIPAQPGEAWLDRRMARVVAASGRWWWEIEGLRDADDAERYRGEWSYPMLVSVYLGWPAYFVAAAGATTRCPNCGRTSIQGRFYCGAPECDQARAIDRKRTSRGRPPESR